MEIKKHKNYEIRKKLKKFTTRKGPCVFEQALFVEISRESHRKLIRKLIS